MLHLLSGNRLPEGSNRLPVANIIFQNYLQSCNHYHEHVIDYQCFKMLDFKFQEVTTSDKTLSNHFKLV